MESLRSIHVSAGTVQRVRRWLGYVAVWAMPSVATVWSVGTFGINWVADVATKSWVGDVVAEVRTASRANQSAADDHAVRLRMLEQRHTEICRTIVRLRAELEVHRRFPRADTKALGDMIDEAQRYYVRSFDSELRIRKSADEAAAKTFELYRWHPPGN